MVVVKQLARGVALFVALGVVLPPSAEGQEAVAPALGQTLNAAVRRIAPPAARQVPPGSATTSPGERRTMEAIRMTSDDTITLDGRLDEDVWMRAVPATNFLQRDPDNGQPATEQTEVRFVYDDDKLYMGVTLFDSEPDKLIHYQMGRDGNLPADDKLQWAIDTFNDGQSAYWWEMNPLGSMADALRGANNSNNRRWDGIWDARTTRSDIGWTIEMEVPFRTMNFNPDSDAWGVNFQRTIARKNETNLWMGWPRNQGLNRMSNAGELTGIRGVSQGRGLDIKPYLVGTSESFPGRDDVTGTTEAHRPASISSTTSRRVFERMSRDHHVRWSCMIACAVGVVGTRGASPVGVRFAGNFDRPGVERAWAVPDHGPGAIARDAFERPSDAWQPCPRCQRVTHLLGWLAARSPSSGAFLPFSDDGWMRAAMVTRVDSVGFAIVAGTHGLHTRNCRSAHENRVAIRPGSEAVKQARTPTS